MIILLDQDLIKLSTEALGNSHLCLYYILGQLSLAARGGQNPPDPTNPNCPAPIRAVFVPFFVGSG
jgi:hypothetical protein